MALKPIEISRGSQLTIPGFGWQALLTPDPYEPKSEVLGLVKFVHTTGVGKRRACADNVQTAAAYKRLQPASVLATEVRCPLTGD